MRQQRHKRAVSSTEGSQKQSSSTIRLAVLALLLGGVASFQVGGDVASATRNGRRSSTVVYVDSRGSADVKQQRQKNAQKKQQMESSPDEEAVDEYLEFLAKRYRRMHEDENSETNGSPVFSAWKWLSNGKDEQVLPVQSQRQQQDALYALGVAGLASKKLLQKHSVDSKMLREASQEENAVVVEALAVEDDESALPQSRRNKVAKVACRAMQCISGTRRSLHEFQNQKLRSAAKASVRAPFRLGRKLFELGGGRHTVLATATVAMALVFVLAKPAAEFVANEGVNMTRSA